MRRSLLPWHHHPDHPHVVVPVRIDPTGRHGPTPKAARCGRWRRVAPGWFVPADVDATGVDQRVVEAAVRLPADSAVTGWGALRWMDERWADHGGDRPRPVPLVIGDAGVRPAPGFDVSEEFLHPREIIVVDGLRVTTPVRSVLYEMRHARTELAAVTALAMACYDDLVSVDEAAAYAATLGTWTGIPLARGAISLGEENFWSPAEVATHRVWTHEARLPRPLANRPVFDLHGTHLGTPDLIDPAAGVIGQYDGVVHLDRVRRDGDIRRDGGFEAVGLRQVTMTAPDLIDPAHAVERLRAAYALAAATPAAGRRWTLELPPWWRPTHTVALRRALAPSDAARLLGYRRAA